MVSVFTSKSPASFVMAKSFLEKAGIHFIPKGENTAGLEYTSFEILVKDEDYNKAKSIIGGIEENNSSLVERYEKRNNPIFGYIIIAMILIAVALLFYLGLWIRETN